MGPGFFGKLPSHGDFVGRHLPPAVRACFDHWLQRALVQSRMELGTAWLPAWLSSPLWRFAINAGVCSEQAWAGVMMPSHDRVGRCFPLLLAGAVDGTPSLEDCFGLHEGWFERLEALALSTLEEGFSLEVFDTALASLAGTRPRGCALRPRTAAGAAETSSVMAFVPGDMPPAGSDTLFERQSAWWTSGSPQVAPCLARCLNLPAPEVFAAMLDGRWAEHGWI